MVAETAAWYRSGMSSASIGNNALVVTAVSAQRRIDRALEWLKGRRQDEELMLVGATLDAVNDLARTASGTNGAVFGWHRFGWPQLVYAIATPLLADRGIVPAGRIGTRALIVSLVQRLRLSKNLSAYGSAAGTPGFPEAIADLVAELRLAGVEPQTLEPTAPELAGLLRAYESELAKCGLADWAAMLKLARDAAGAAPSRLLGLPTLLLDVPVTTRLEQSILKVIGNVASDLLALFPSADAVAVAHGCEALGLMAHDCDPPLDGAGAARGTLSQLQRHLFAKHETPPRPMPINDEVEVFSAPGEGRECVEIARRVLAIAAGGVSFDRIAVLLRSPSDYRAQLREALSRAGIPVHFARGTVLPDPAGRAFYALLECAAEGLSARKFAEYLSLGQVPDVTPEGAPPDVRTDRWVAPDPESAPPLSPASAADATAPSVEAVRSVDGPVRDGQLRTPRRWEKLLIDAAVIGGRDRWHRRIEGLRNQLRLEIEQGGEDDDVKLAATRRVLTELEALADYALPLIADLEALPSEATWKEWLLQLSGLATRALRRPDHVLATLTELAPLGEVGPVGIDEVLTLLRELLLETSAAPSSQRYGKIFVGPIDAARGLSFHAVFVPGLAEKMFPRKIVEEPILLDAARARIGQHLVTNQARVERERLALCLAVGAAEARLYLSYPRIDLEEGRPRVPSFYALEAIRAAEGRLPDFAELARRAETATASHLGWPAPSLPELAIDDAEHDLAVLAGLMGRPESNAGRARYLLSSNPNLARALRARYQRWGPNWTAADGLLSPTPAGRAALERHALGARSYSPTALQSFARCPYRFFLYAVHGLAPREMPSPIDDLDPLQRGSLIHDIQFELLAKLAQQGVLPVRPNNLQLAHRQLEDVIFEVAAQHKDRLAPAIDRVWETGVAEIRADLREWLRLASEDSSGFVPRHFELSFGLGRRTTGRQADASSGPDPVPLDCGLQLRGSIDLVERHPSGLLRVTDHKTGKAAGKSDQLIDGGLTLQPVLYALVAERLFSGDDKVAGGRLYFSTSAGGFSEVMVALDDRARRAAGLVAETIGGAIAAPFLPAAPAEGECERCVYRVVCGPYEEQRSARKPQRGLESLRRLREEP